jgi:SAM-dependent methyltransferase
MPMVRKTISIYLPQWLYRFLHREKKALFGYKNMAAPNLERALERTLPGVNMSGDRDVEYSFIAAQMPWGPGEALDFGSGGTYISLIAACRHFKVMALDLMQPEAYTWKHPRVRFVKGDLLKLALPQNHFDLIINCSTVEHVGLVGRYGVTEERSDGDLEAMRHLQRLLKPKGIMLLTIPVGQDAIFAPLHRVYGLKRLPRLLECYKVIHEELWIKDSDNRWMQCEKDKALQFKPFAKSSQSNGFAYAIGCFVLHPL